MASLSHWHGHDLQTSANGSLLLLASGTELGQQSVTRRMLSNEGDHPWLREYGAGLPSFIGMPAYGDRIRGAILKNARAESTIDQRQPINVDVRTDPATGVTVADLKYTDATSGETTLARLRVGGV